jgi:hypothetical protein
MIVDLRRSAWQRTRVKLRLLQRDGPGCRATVHAVGGCGRLAARNGAPIGPDHDRLTPAGPGAARVRPTPSDG